MTHPGYTEERYARTLKINRERRQAERAEAAQAQVQERRVPLPAPTHGWEEGAPCATLARKDPGLRRGFFPIEDNGGRGHRGRVPAEILALCEGCPVRRDCTLAVLRMPQAQRWGVWGGRLYDGTTRNSKANAKAEGLG